MRNYACGIPFDDAVEAVIEQVIVEEALAHETIGSGIISLPENVESSSIPTRLEDLYFKTYFKNSSRKSPEIAVTKPVNKKANLFFVEKSNDLSTGKDSRSRAGPY